MFATVFKVILFCFETRELILGQIAYTRKFSSCKASMQPPVSLTFIHGPMILPYISNTVKWINIIPGIIDQSYTGSGLTVTVH